MYKSKIVVMTFIIFVISMLFINNNFAQNLSVNNEEIPKWKVKITSGTKDLTFEDTQEIKFKIQENKNVAYGKIAPGCKAIANIEIDLTKTAVPVEIVTTIDDKNLYDCFELSSKLDEEPYFSGTKKIIELENNLSFTKKNGKKHLTIEVEWKNDDKNNINDTILGLKAQTISIPVKINVMQHI